LIVRLQLFLERIGWKRVAVAAIGVVALIAAGTVFAVTRGGGGKGSTGSTRSTTPEVSTNLFYLRAVAPKVQASGCTMNIRFTWKPDYHAEQYIGASAVIVANGTDIQGAYRKRFTAKGVSLDVGPISFAGGYRIWSARVESLDGDPPGNDTTIQAAPPSSTKCG